MFHAGAESWHVDLGGRSLLMFTIDHRVSLYLYGESGYDGLVIFATPFEVSAARASAVTVDPARKGDLGPLLSCFEKVVESASVERDDGTLVMTFTDGTTITARSDTRYEAWELNVAGTKIVATPGGGEPALFRV